MEVYNHVICLKEENENLCAPQVLFFAEKRISCKYKLNKYYAHFR